MIVTCFALTELNGTTRVEYPYTDPSQEDALLWRLVGLR
jgi:hypothetical protein